MDEHLAGYLDLLKLLVRTPSVVGAEAPFFAVVRRELEECGVTVVQHQGLLVAHGSRPESLLLSAHADRHGLLCTGPDEFQYAAFVARNQGDLTGDSVSEQRVETIDDRFSGQRVQAYEPWSGGYLGQGVIDSAYLCPRRRNLVFTVAGLDYLRPGTPVGFLDRLTHQDGVISAQLDNVLSVALLLWLFTQGFQGTGFFTAEEEAGRSWRYLLSWFQRENLQTKRLLVLDTSPYADRAAADAQDVVLRRRDANGVFDKAMVEELQRTTVECDVQTAFKDEVIAAANTQRAAEGLKPQSLGRTELGRLVAATEGGLNGATLQIPTWGYHTAEESASLTGMQAMLTLLNAIAHN